jgi:hypothetical protein
VAVVEYDEGWNNLNIPAGWYFVTYGDGLGHLCDPDGRATQVYPLVKAFYPLETREETFTLGESGEQK